MQTRTSNAVSIRLASSRKSKLRSMCFMLALVVISACAALAVRMFSGTVYYVTKSGNDGNDGQTWATAKASIQAAVNTAANGDQVWIAEGTYSEHVATNTSLAIYGGFVGSETSPTQRDLTAHTTAIDGGGSRTEFSAGNCALTLDGLTLQNGQQGIDLYNLSEFKLLNCKVLNNINEVGDYGYAGGMLAQAMSSIDIEDTTFSGNAHARTDLGNAEGGAIMAPHWDATFGSFTLKRCTFSNNRSASQGAAVFAPSWETVVVEDCTFSGNHTTNPNFWGSGALMLANWANQHGTLSVTNSTFSGNASAGTGEGGVTVYGFTTVNIQNCGILANSSGANGGAVINGCQAVNVVHTNVKNNTGHNIGGISIQNSTDVLVSQCEISGNQATDPTFDIGGGYVLNTSGTLLVERCLITNNQAGQTGGLQIDNSPNATVNLNLITDNRGINNDPYGCVGGLRVFGVPSGSTLTVTNNTFSGNQATGPNGAGGGFCNFDGQLILSHNTITGNTGTFVSGFQKNGGTLSANQNNFTGNSGQYAQAFFGNAATIANSLFARNTSTNGLTAVRLDGVGAVINNTFASNITSRGFTSGGSGGCAFRNNIIYGNPEWGAESWGNTINSDYNCYFGNGWGNSNGITMGQHDFVLDPKFVDPAGGDFHLSPDSKCVNHGDNGTVVGTLDLDDHARLQMNVVDCGCFESPYDRINHAPIALDDTGYSDGGVNTRINVLANDSDPDGDPIHVVSTSQGVHGSVTFDATSCLYIPAPGYSGPDSFIYTITDGSLNSSATVYITVSASQDDSKVRRLWVRRAFTPNDDLGYDLAVDPDGTTTSGGYLGTNTNDGNLYLQGITVNNSVLYSLQYSSGNPGLEGCTSLVRDGAGNTYGAGVLAGANGRWDWLVFKANSSGAILAAHYFDGASAGYDAVNKLVRDSAGNIYAAGFVDNAGTRGDGVVIKYDANLNVLWRRDLNTAGSNPDFWMNMELMPDGGVTAIGVTYTNGNNPDMLLARYAADGTLVFQDVYGTAGQEFGNYVSSDAAGNYSAIATGPGGNTVRHYSNSNVLLWTVTVPGTWCLNDQDYGAQLVCDSAGNTYVSTYAAGDISLVKLDPNGVVVWSRLYDGPADGDDLPTNIKLDRHGFLYISGAETAAGQGHNMLALSYDTDGNFRWKRTLNGSASGEDHATYIAFNDSGVVSVNGAMTTTGLGFDAASFSLQQAPVGAADTYSTAEDTPITGATSVLTNDIFAQTATAQLVSGPTKGTLTLRPDGTFDYTPNQDANGQDTFTYLVVNGTLSSDPVPVTINITPVNDPPVAKSQSVTTNEDTAVGVTLQGTDVEGDPLSYTVVTPPAHGMLTGTAPNLTYTSSLNYNGSDSFTFKANDGQADSNVATVSITINPVNDPPVAVNDTAATAKNTPVLISVLANDSDVDGDALTITGVTQGAKGTVVINANETVTYTPAGGQLGTDTFTYTISDGHGGTASATVTVNITNTTTNHPPTAVNDSASCANHKSVKVIVLANDSDVDGDPISVVSITQPTNGTSVLNGDNTVTYTPTGAFNGTDKFNYTITDGKGGLATATVSISVAVNGKPVAVSDAATTLNTTPITINVLANDSDPDGDAISVTGITQPLTGGSAVNNGDGTVTFTPTAGFKGKATITYTISDGYGGTATGNVAVTVTANNPPKAVADSVTTAHNTPIKIDVLANDSDPDGDPLTVVSVTQPLTGGTVAINGDNTVTFTPTAGFKGKAKFTYTISDGRGGTDTTNVTVTVQ